MARFSVTYWIGSKDEAEARARAAEIAVEQTVEIPDDIVPEGYVRDEILGRVEDVTPAPGQRGGYFARISYSDDDIGDDFPQLLNVIFGNSSIRPDCRVESMILSEGILAICQGPRFGPEGLRKRAGIANGPLLMSAIKPVGLPVAALADLAHRFALGGVNYIKDDHGLANQKTSPFRERLKACTDAVGEANAKTGGKSLYVPNITGPAELILDRALAAQEQGAGGVMLAPSLTGYDAARMLRARADFNLPIISHPAFGGANIITPTTGFSHAFFFGTLQRLMGVDAVVYPNFGGRFSFSREECLSIVSGCSEPLDGLPPAMPTPGGGMTFERIPQMVSTYGDNVMYLMGGALLREQDDLPGACKRLRNLLHGQLKV
ncbi:RuBisCO large subunit C-terminal-like domain-containing protein [Brucella sp. IR073]|uniref:RuBisCO large subunit C-terminal-like domain-containing protein n=1 Tax=unclassified Brucella TaxID=2632610 RepID=UPI003B97ED9E